jgi:integrase
MGLYKPPKSRFWHYRFECQKKTHRGTTGTTDRREAARIERQVRARVEAAAPKPSAHVTISDLAALELDQAEDRGVTPKEVDTRRKRWVHILEFLGKERDAASVRFVDLEALVSHLRQHYKGQTVTRYRAMLQRGYRRAVELELLDTMPAVWPRIKSDPKDERRTGKDVAEKTLLAWLDVLRSRDRAQHKRTRGAYGQALILVLTGLRIAEARRLTKAWVRKTPSGHELVVPAEAAKTRRTRPIPLTPLAVQVIDARAKEIGTLGAPLWPRDHKKAFRAAAREVGLGSIAPRDLRHTFGSWIEHAGDSRAAQQLLGHTTVQTTLHYTHASLERCRGAVTEIGRKLG